jgi:hypothetical protein
MTPERAAELLGVSAEASPAEIERAFARRARETHPDRFVEDPDGGRAHTREFAEIARARDVLATRARRRAAEEAERASAAGAGLSEGAVVVRRPLSVPLLTTWIVLLAVAAFLATYLAPHPLTVAEPLVRWTLLGAALVGFAVTGRRRLLTAIAVLTALTALMTILFAGLGGFLGLLLLIPCAYGLCLMGLARRPRLAQRLPVDN